MSLEGRVTALRDRLRRRRKQTTDPNFIGFDKYRRLGAYHWAELKRSEEYQTKISILAERVGPNDRCLDLGCGDGAYAYELSRRCREVVGVDADFDAIRLANRELRAAGVQNVTCRQLPLGEVASSGLGSFDFVYSMDVLEHLPRPEELLEVAASMVAPGGAVVIGTPLYINDELISPYHVTEYTDEQLREMVGRFFEIDEVLILDGVRADGVRYPQDFWAAFCEPRL